MVGLTDADPEVAVLLVNAEEQDVALVEVHVSVEELPCVIEVGLADTVTVGAGTGVTVRVAFAVVVPPAPVQVSVYVLVAEGAIETLPPLVGVMVPSPWFMDAEVLFVQA